MARETADSWDYISFPIDSIMYGMFQSVPAFYVQIGSRQGHLQYQC